MDAIVSDRSPLTARPSDPREPVVPTLQHLMCNLPSALRIIVSMVVLCAIAALLCGATWAGAGQTVGAPRASLPVILLPGHDAAAMSVSITCPKDISVG